MTNHLIRTTQITVVPEDQPIFSEQAITVSIVDESGGEFVEVQQASRTEIGKITINPEEWPALREAISLMIADCREDS